MSRYVYRHLIEGQDISICQKCKHYHMTESTGMNHPYQVFCDMMICDKNNE